MAMMLGHQRDDEQGVAELRAARERGGPVAGVHVADSNHVARPEEGSRPGASGCL